MKISNHAVLAALTLSVAIFASGAEAHARLDSASPAVGSTVSSSPSQVDLHFTEALEPKFSGATVHAASGARVDTGSSASGSTIHVGVKSLGAGSYTVNWHALSVDTHKTQGSFSFHVGK
ncbi:copper resistance protein CopC [Hyphomicrobium sp. ghe19]|uniref:copper resistance CopC family protein n=1 Tax=Hyphomicrobium sp. ghe19 TaxID=2682968 RepID=UPI001366C62A|nr:Copper resistance protein C [Hyphomicrobium sp. ghe19]